MAMLPEGWKESSIGEITSTNSLFSDGDWVESKDQDPAGTNRLIQLADIGDGVFINKSSRYMNDEQFQRLKCTSLKKNDILIARMPDPLGRACLYPLESGKAATVVDVAVLRTENADHYWLMSAINSSNYRYQIDLNASGTTRTRIARGILSEIEILEPPLPEQQKIATILSSVDDVIEKTRAQIDKLKDLKTGMMQELLTKGIGHTEFKDSPVGRIPHSWDVFQLSQLARIGSSKRILQSEYVEEGVPFYRSKEVIRRSKGLEIENTLYISVDRFLELSDKFGSPKKGDILITAVGTIGTVYLVEDREFYFKDGNLLWLRDIKAKVSSEYLAKIMQSEQFQDYIKRVIGGSSQSALTIEKLAELHVLLPRKEEQYQIVSILSSIESKYYLAMNKLNTLKSVKKALMQDLLTGKVRVKTQKDMLKNVE